MSKDRVKCLCSLKRLEIITERRLNSLKDFIQLLKPSLNNPMYRSYCYRIWTCEDILKEIKDARDIPFYLTANELLEAYIRKMNRFWLDSPKSNASLCFFEAFQQAMRLQNEYILRKGEEEDASDQAL